MNIPFVDLVAQYQTIKPEIDAAIAGCLGTASFIAGEKVRQFEDAFARFVGVRHCIGTGNGTDSIEILLKAMGMGSGNEVIVPALTWISTSEAVSSVGARPVFVDIHPDFYTIDTSRIEEKITARTKAIIPVHLYGLPAAMDELMRIASKHELLVLEDCAQSHGAVFKERKTGTFGQAASFSFYPGKNLGAYGDAGAMLCNDDRLAEQARMLGNHGQFGKHDHRIEGRNSRMDAMQAAVLTVKLKYLEAWNEKRIKAAQRYSALLKSSSVILPQTPAGSKHVFHLFVVRVKERDRALRVLESKGVSCGIHYPKALPFLKPYRYLNAGEVDFPVAAQVQDEILSLPMFPEITDERIEYVCETLRQAI